MNIYLLINNVVKGYDTYDSCVVAANSFEEARTIHPGNPMEDDQCYWVAGEDGRWRYPADDEHSAGKLVDEKYLSWCQPRQVNVALMGKLNKSLGKDGKPFIICSSFNAG